jgi:hypothetical protein
MSIIPCAMPTGHRPRRPRRHLLTAVLFAAALLGCGSTEPIAGTAGRYMLAGCTYPDRGVTTPEQCSWGNIEWSHEASYYDLGADGRLTLVERLGSPSLGMPGSPSARYGSWTEAAGWVVVTWDGTLTLPTTLERIDAITLRDARTFPGAIYFWFVKAR